MRAERSRDPRIRGQLITAALAFVRAVLTSDNGQPTVGVERVALIGSLTTTKLDPKDVDLLLTVTDRVDLERLAHLGRSLKGRLQSHNHGADIFLANPDNGYLGRTCSWRECRPGIRASCDALHCGRRPYLHDDLATVTLSPSLVAVPPIELWPRVVVRTRVPDDLARELLEPLRQFERRAGADDCLTP